MEDEVLMYTKCCGIKIINFLFFTVFVNKSPLNLPKETMEALIILHDRFIKTPVILLSTCLGNQVK